MKNSYNKILEQNIKWCMALVILFIAITDTSNIYSSDRSSNLNESFQNIEEIYFLQSEIKRHDEFSHEPSLEIEEWMMDEDYLFKAVKSSGRTKHIRKVKQYKIDEGVQFERILG